MKPLEIPDTIRLIASVSRLIDLHQSRREGNGVSVPSVPEKGGYYLSISLIILDCLHHIEIENGVGIVSLTELSQSVNRRVYEATKDDIEYCVLSLSQEREIHYGIEDGNGHIDLARTWETTPLLSLASGFKQVQLTDNARLLMRVSSLKDSWMYSDLDADRLVKAIERGQFKDVPRFCKEMTLDLATKSRDLSGLLEHPSTSELRELLLAEGQNIANSLNAASDTIKVAINLIFDDRTKITFNTIPDRDKPNFQLFNLQADLELVLTNVESVTRSFLKFVNQAQSVKTQGSERIKFLELANDLVLNPIADMEVRLNALLRSILPWSIESTMFHSSMMVGQVDFRQALPPENISSGFTVNPQKYVTQSTFSEFLMRNKEVIHTRLKEGPMLFTEALSLTGYVLKDGESPLDFFGAYASPNLLDGDTTKIIIGISDEKFKIKYDESLLVGTNPIMILEEQ